jgi:hypothetical protein
VGGSSATFAGDGGGGSVVTACAREDELQWVARSEGSIEGTPPPPPPRSRERTTCVQLEDTSDLTRQMAD